MREQLERASILRVHNAVPNDKILAFSKLIVWCLTSFLRVFHLYRGSQCTYPCIPGVLLTGIPHNILYNPVAAFPLNHCQNKGQQWQRNESCCNDYHQSLERISAEPGIEPATSCSQVLYVTNWAIGISSSKLRTFADDKFIVTKKITYVLHGK